MAKSGLHLIKECIICGVFYKQSRSDQLCCSKKCTHKNWRDKNNIVILKCKICNNDFKRLHSNQKYCSKDCAKKAERQIKRLKFLNNYVKVTPKQKNIKICLVCNNEFKTLKCYEKRGEMHGKFCSKKCKGIYQSIQLNEKYKELREQKIIIKENKQIEKEKRKENIILNKCKNCGNDTKRTFCNFECYTNYLKKNLGSKNIKTNCLFCNKEIIVTPGQVNAGFGKYCSISCGAMHHSKTKTNPYQNSKGGKREDLNNVYFRSRWEANFARYLNFLIKQNQILKWEFEPDTFIFHEIKRGTRSYLPDFKVFENNGNIVYYEIKGYMDDRSKTKLKRMEKYYPDIKIIVVDKTAYKELNKKLKDIIPNWEIDNNKKYEYR